MSQMTTARVGARALNRPDTTTPRLRVVTGAPPQRGGVAFGIVCATLLAIGLVGLLLLNTALAQGSFTLQKLEATSDQLTDTEDSLNESLSHLQSPAILASRASAMGMVPAQSAAFLRLSDGKVIGAASPAPPVPGFTVVRRTSPPPPRPAKKKAKSAPGGRQHSAAAPKPTKPTKPTTR